MLLVIADDEDAVCDSLSRTFRFEGYAVRTAKDGREALDAIREHRPDGVVLDVTMPVLDGLEACRLLRAEGNLVPVLMLTARDDVNARVAGLDSGADDYLAKPFALQELLARVRALVRRTRYEALAEETPELRFDDLTLNPVTREVERAGRQVRLTRTEFAILELFMRHPRQVLTRSVLFEDVWGFDYGGGSNSLDVYLGYLRKKLEADGGRRLLHTVRGVGYVLREAAL
ncbi:response regulator transcription factor [Glycomyces sp. NPDC047010]|uniref:response regulator transcription factor n=1 Tax=Glycomyces sp. NPDC047010 TaxID=3155023 RepID=UPI0033C95449